MIVTRIVEHTSSRSKVYIDEEFAFVLYKGELRLYKVCEGEEMSEDVYHKIMAEVLPKRAKLRAMNLLQSREYTRAKLREKLKDGYYPAQIIEEALDYVESYHYIDDLRYAKEYIRQAENSRSKKRIEQDLMKKGVSGELIEKAFLEWEEEDGKIDEQKLIQDLLRKRGYSAENADFKRKQKEFAFLLRKGFGAEEVRKALDISSFSV